jgi:hypothetical protein
MNWTMAITISIPDSASPLSQNAGQVNTCKACQRELSQNRGSLQEAARFCKGGTRPQQLFSLSDY